MHKYYDFNDLLDMVIQNYGQGRAGSPNQINNHSSLVARRRWFPLKLKT